MLLSRTPKTSKAQKKAILGVGTQAQACKHTTRRGNGTDLCFLCFRTKHHTDPEPARLTDRFL